MSESELHSLRHHLDSNVLVRIRELEEVAEAALVYLKAALIRDTGTMDVALGVLLIRLEDAGYPIKVKDA